MIDDADTRHCWWWMTPAAGRSVQSTDCCFFLFGQAVYKAVPPDSLITPFILKNPKTRWNQSNKCLKWRLSVNFFCTSETSTSELPFRGDQPSHINLLMLGGHFLPLCSPWIESTYKWLKGQLLKLLHTKWCDLYFLDYMRFDWTTVWCRSICVTVPGVNL